MQAILKISPEKSGSSGLGAEIDIMAISR